MVLGNYGNSTLLELYVLTSANLLSPIQEKLYNITTYYGRLIASYKKCVDFHVSSVTVMYMWPDRKCVIIDCGFLYFYAVVTSLELMIETCLFLPLVI